MEHVPTRTNETVSPATEQTSGVFDVNITGNPADEVAVTANGPKLMDRGGICLKVMTCFGLVIVKLRLTAGAAANMALPACVAETVQVPAAIRVSVVPATEQAPVVVLEKATGNPELAVATRFVGGSVTSCAGKVANVIVWGASVTLNERVIDGAAA